MFENKNEILQLLAIECQGYVMVKDLIAMLLIGSYKEQYRVVIFGGEYRNKFYLRQTK